MQKAIQDLSLKTPEIVYPLNLAFDGATILFTMFAISKILKNKNFGTRSILVIIDIGVAVFLCVLCFIIGVLTDNWLGNDERKECFESPNVQSCLNFVLLLYNDFTINIVSPSFGRIEYLYG